MAIKDLYPSVHPTLDLNFTGTRTVDPRITFSRASTATYFDEFGVMRTVHANSPRIDFDPVTGECKGLLLEEQRTNLLKYSERFDNSSWNNGDATIQADTTIAPDGALSADKFIPNNVSTIHRVTVSSSVISGTSYTISIYAKAGGYSGIGVVLAEAGFGTNTVDYFDLTTGKVTTNASGAAGISHVGNGWYRCTATRTATATIASTFEFRVGLTGLTSFNFAGDGTSGIYIWGAQLEAGSFPTSYIPTTSAQATRAADSAAITGSNFSSWYRQDEGTIYCEAEYFGPNSADATSTGIVTLGDGTSSNFLSLIVRTDSKSSRATFANGTISNTPTNSYIENTVAKFAIGYKNLDCVFSKDGGVLTENNSINTIPFNQLFIGAYYSIGSRRLNGRIKRISFYPKRVSNTNDQALTT